MSDGDFIIFADVTVVVLIVVAVADVVAVVVVVFSTLTDSPFQRLSSIAIRSIASSESFQKIAEIV